MVNDQSHFQKEISFSNLTHKALQPLVCSYRAGLLRIVKYLTILQFLFAAVKTF